MSRAGLDGWLNDAEAVLREQRERSISPSSDPAWAVEPLERTMRFAQLADDLEVVLRSLCERPGRWILIAEDAAHPHHFWQALCFEDGSLHVEVVSNHYLEGDDRLTAEQEATLRIGGWTDPAPPRSMCWARTEFTMSPDVGAVAQQAAGALREVFGLGDRDKVFVKMFSSPLRGHTPASPTHEGVVGLGDAPSGYGRDYLGTGLIDPFDGPDGEDPDIFGSDPEVGVDELNGPWDDNAADQSILGPYPRIAGANNYSCAYTFDH